MAAAGQRSRLIEDGPGLGDNEVTTDLVVAPAAGRPVVVGNRIRPVKRIIQAAPPRIGRVQRVAGIGDRHHQLRPGNRRDFRVHVRGVHRDRRRFLDQIADVPQETQIALWVGRFALVGHMPGVDLRLDGVAFAQQRLAARRQVLQQRREPVPERGLRHASPRQSLARDEIIQRLRDAQAGLLDEIHQAGSSKVYVNT